MHHPAQFSLKTSVRVHQPHQLLLTGDYVPPVRITLPDGTIIDSDQPDIDRILSNVVRREVKLEGAFSEKRTATAEEYWPDIEGLDHRDTVTDFGLPEGTFFDCAVVHMLTTATLDRLRSLYPEGASRSDGFAQTLWWRPRAATGISWRMPGSGTSSRSGIPFVSASLVLVNAA